MRRHGLTLAVSRIIAFAVVVTACSEPTTSIAPEAPLSAAVKFWESGASVAWNATARQLIVSRAVNTPIAQVRILTYLSVAQYNAVVTAEAAKDGGDHASGAAAAGAASLVVLKSFFPLDHALLDSRLAAQEAAAGWPGDKNTNFDAGETIGRAIGAQVVQYAVTDNTNVTPLPPNPGGPGNWTGTNPIRGLYGTRTFALTSGDQFRPAPPPAFGSPVFNAALAEVVAMTSALTAPQLAIAQLWAPRGPGYMNSVAADMIVAHHKTEREAARILALANMAGFDVANACFDAKFAYWFIRPSQANASIPLPIGLPNHPSYPSGHSCITSAYATVLAKHFPEETAAVNAMTLEAGLSRNYGGLHYKFDCEVGQELGRNVADYVMQVAPHSHQPIPLD
jgi:membrane-associated phospholipid phosphatase